MSDEKKDPKKEIHISVDNEQTKILAEELARERIKNDKLVDRIAGNEVKEDHNDLATLKIQAIQKFGRPDLFLDADSKESLSARITNYINEIAEKGKGAPSGTARCDTPQQMGVKNDLYTRKFYDSQQMVSELRRLSHEGTPQEKAEAERYLNELWKKYVLDKRSNPTRGEASQNLNTPEALLELDLVQRDGFLCPRDKENSEVGQLQKKWRMERKRRMEGNTE